MTESKAKERFWRLLKKYRGQFQVGPYLEIRCVETGVCPIIAVCQSVWPKQIYDEADNDEAFDLAMDIDLPKEFADEIVHAADGNLGAVSKRLRLRKRLLRTLAIKEKSK